MEKGEHLKRQNRPTMLQLQYLQRLSKVEKKRGAQGSIAEYYSVNRSTVNRYFKSCIERGILTESLEFTPAGEEWLERYSNLYENLEKYLEEIGAKPEEIEESLDVMVENIDIHMLELMINAYAEKKSVYKKKENELDQEIQYNLQKCKRHTDWAFLNLRSVPGMYRSIQELGEIFDREDQAQKLVDEFTEFYDDYKKKNEGKDHPKVMILMGLPGSYIIATPNSYVGSLVELAGGENVYSDTDQEFLTVNTEDMKTKEPDIILRAAHALPDQVVEMFNKDFAENDIWQHFDAVKNGRVYDLTYEYFGMSATFKYPQALEELQPILYPESDEDSAKAKETSDNAQKKAKDSDATEKYNEQQSK